MAKTVILFIYKGSFEEGFNVSLEIREGDRLVGTSVDASLPPNLQLLDLYRDWQSQYLGLVDILHFSRTVPTIEKHRVSKPDIMKAEETLRQSTNQWLYSKQFRPIAHHLKEKLHSSEEILTIINTNLADLQKLPWCCWDSFKKYRKLEVVLSLPPKESVPFVKDRLKILAVFGSNKTSGETTQINMEKDWNLLEQHLGDTRTIDRLQEPTLEQLHERLWQDTPDILYYGGHSSMEVDGTTTSINLSGKEQIQIKDLNYALQKAVDRGLQVAIFNSCAGLGIARQLADTGIPNVIVMREVVPDEVAQYFLQYFLEEFSQGIPMYLAVLNARKQMGHLDKKYPGSTWLPMIFKNPLALPFTWKKVTSVSVEENSDDREGTVVNINESNDTKDRNSSFDPKNSVSSQSVSSGNISSLNQEGITHHNEKVEENPNRDLKDNVNLDRDSFEMSNDEADLHEVVVEDSRHLLNPEKSANNINQNDGDVTNVNPITTEYLMKVMSGNILQIGYLLKGRYQIVHTLGSGGFGQTYLAQDMQEYSFPRCVVKHLKPKMIGENVFQDALRRFHIEVDVLKRLGKHQQIPTLLDSFEDEGEFYLVQEFISGENLKNSLITRKKFLESEVIKILKDVLEILASAVHHQNVIHRDIKPQNLIRRENGKIVLIDFGAVKEISALSTDMSGEKVITQAIGSAAYMPPEQLGGKPKFCSDIYALGITAIELLTGKYPDRNDLYNVVFPEKIEMEAHPKLLKILNKMVCINYKNRYQSAVEVLGDLKPLTKLGQILGGRYTIAKYLGGSTFSNTYCANSRIRSYQSPCIIKEIQIPEPDESGKVQDEVLDRFTTEINVFERIGVHSQIPRLFDHFDENNALYLVEEFIDGDSLQQKIYKNGNLSQDRVIYWTKSVLRGLEYLHSKNIIHCDLKPSNLIARTSPNKVVLIDFGVSQNIDDMTSGYFDKKDSPQRYGTEGYMAPEQLAGRPTFSSDIYALGMTAIEALTGIPPTRLETDPNTGELRLREISHVDRELRQILVRMVRYNFQERYQSATEVLRDLDRLPFDCSPDTRENDSIVTRVSGFFGRFFSK